MPLCCLVSLPFLVLPPPVHQQQEQVYLLLRLSHLLQSHHQTCSIKTTLLLLERQSGIQSMVHVAKIAPQGVLYRFGGILVFLYPPPLSSGHPCRCTLKPCESTFAGERLIYRPPCSRTPTRDRRVTRCSPAGVVDCVKHTPGREWLFFWSSSRSLFYRLPLDWTSGCFSEVPLHKDERPDRQVRACGVRHFRRSRSGGHFLEQGVLQCPHPEPSRFTGLAWS